MGGTTTASLTSQPSTPIPPSAPIAPQPPGEAGAVQAAVHHPSACSTSPESEREVFFALCFAPFDRHHDGQGKHCLITPKSSHHLSSQSWAGARSRGANIAAARQVPLSHASSPGQSSTSNSLAPLKPDRQTSEDICYPCTMQLH